MFGRLRGWTVSFFCLLSAFAYLGVTVLRWRAERVYDEGIAVGNRSWEFGARSGGPGLGVAFYRGPSELHGVQTWCYRTSGQADRDAGRMAEQVRHRVTWAGADLEHGSYRLALRADGSTAGRQDRDVGLRSAAISYWSVQHVPHEWVMAGTALPPLVWVVRRVRRSAVRRRRARRGLCAHCGYDLRGSPAGRCSECGHAAPAPAARTVDAPLSPVAEPAAVGSNGAEPKGEPD